MSFFDTSNFMRQINFDFFDFRGYAHEYDKNLGTLTIQELHFKA